jgi:hypothetical protein
MPEPAEKLIKCIVARGCTIEGPHPTETRTVQDAGGELVVVPKTKRYGPGEEVLIPASEVKRLRELLYLVDPDNAPPPMEDRSTGRLPGQGVIDLAASPERYVPGYRGEI